MSEYAVTGKDAGAGSLLAALAEAGFLIGLEKNRFCSFTKICFLSIFQNAYICTLYKQSFSKVPEGKLYFLTI